MCVTRHENTFETIGVGFCVCVRSAYWENRWASIMPGYSIVDSDATALPSPPNPSRKRICLSPSIMIYLRVETWLIFSFPLYFSSSSTLQCCISLKVTPELSRGHFFLIFPLTDWVSGFAQTEGKTASRDRYRFFSRRIQNFHTLSLIHMKVKPPTVSGGGTILEERRNSFFRQETPFRVQIRDMRVPRGPWMSFSMRNCQYLGRSWEGGGVFSLLIVSATT